MANGISLKLISHDKVFENTPNPVIVNDIAATLATGRAAETINDLIRTHYPDDKLNTLPACECGLIVGGYNERLICGQCNTEVQRVVDRPLRSHIWMRTPAEIPAFISPRFWALFTDYTTTKRFDLLEWLTDPQYIPGGRGNSTLDKDPRVRAVADFIASKGIKRGLKHFYHDFDRTMGIILTPENFYRFKGGKDMPGEIPPYIELRDFIAKYRDCIFSRYLPFPSRIVLVSEQAGNNTYNDPNMSPAFNAVKTLCSIENDPMRLSTKAIESRTVKVIKLLTEYYTFFKQKTCGTKKGIFRRQLGSTRSPFTGRAVIAPLAMHHEYDEVHTPWAWTISLCRVLLENKLLGRDFNPRELFRVIDKHTNNSVGPGADLLDEILNELISECPEGGLPIAMLRNPTLERLSDQLFRITKVIRNTKVYAIMISVLAVKGGNGDFDGDMYQTKLMIDNKEKRQFSRLRAHLGIMDTDSPHRVKGIITLHPESITMLNNFLDHNRC